MGTNDIEFGLSIKFDLAHELSKVGGCVCSPEVLIFAVKLLSELHRYLQQPNPPAWVKWIIVSQIRLVIKKFGQPHLAISNSPGPGQGSDPGEGEGVVKWVICHPTPAS